MDEAVGYDVLIVGSGFGGSLAALRLSEKGYRVADMHPRAPTVYNYYSRGNCV